MDDLIEEAPAPDIVVRHAAGTEVDIRPDPAGAQPLVGIGNGTVWARAEPGSAGIDIGHGTLNIVVRQGTVLVDAQGGAGLVIVLRGVVEIASGGLPVATGVAGDALTFDATGGVRDPDPVDATELARDPFVSLNLVLDALHGVPVSVAARATPDPAPPQEQQGAAPDRKRTKSLFGRSKK